MVAQTPVLVWFRQDLRLTDNPALAAAAATGLPVIPVFILDDAAAGRWAPGGASRWWLHHSLLALQRDLAGRGVRLMLRRGPAAEIIPALAAETGAAGVYWNRCYEPAAIARDTALKAALEARRVAARSFNAGLLFEPWTVTTRTGDPYRVYTPFWKACLAAPEPPRPEAAPARLRAAGAPAGDALADWALLPTRPDWAQGLRAEWTPGEAGAAARLDAFLARAVERYKADRDRPDLSGTSRLSPHLHFGEIGPRQVWHATRAIAWGKAGADSFLSEIGWREFGHHLLFHFPTLAERNWRGEFDAFPWRDDAQALAAWQRGRTGYPIVDAGMRELWATGWMHNRVRMVAASFLVKDLLIDWRRGADWFWDTLVDADLANNAAGWQWVAGCGADAAPYFRVFNPVIQGEKFDPSGRYVRHWLPELARLPDAFVHKPWLADAVTLAGAGVRLGTTYPRPIIDHAVARDRALAALASLKETAA